METLFTFGKYKGQSYQHVLDIDKKYCKSYLTKQDPHVSWYPFIGFLLSQDDKILNEIKYYTDKKVDTLDEYLGNDLLKKLELFR